MNPQRIPSMEARLDRMEAELARHDRAIATLAEFQRSHEIASEALFDDVDELKLKERELTMAWRLNLAVGGFVGSLLIALLTLIVTAT